MTNKMTKTEYETLVKNAFYKLLDPKILNAHDCFDDRYVQCIKNFHRAVKDLGLSFSNPYHANGIGNNTEMGIVLRETDQDGFIIEKHVCNFVYITGIYHGVQARLEDINGKVIANIGDCI